LVQVQLLPPLSKGEKMEAVTEEKAKGAFVQSLRRNNAKIREDRATSIAEDTQLVYKRQIEDLEMNLKKMKREQENMLDLSPSDAQSLVLASDFDSNSYVNKDIELGVKIRNTEIKLEIAKKRYDFLFFGAN
jgi:hypothetical protein